MISIWSRLIDLIAPRACVMCGKRLGISKHVLCGACNLTLPRTNYHQDALENELAKVFWGRIPIEKAAAFFFYQANSPSSNMIYSLKYGNQPELGIELGQIFADECQHSDFFEGIDAIVSVPLARKRVLQRGYNQSDMIAQGVSLVTRLPIIKKAVKRNSFEGSQTQKVRSERNENVEHAFHLLRPDLLQGKHLLLIDDVITTGATITALAKEILKAKDVKISVLSLCHTKGK